MVQIASKSIGIDCRSLEAGPGGVTTYVTSLLQHLPELECIGDRFPGHNFLWNQFRVPAAQIRRGWRLFHAPAYTGPLWIRCPLVLSVHDLSYLSRPEWYPYSRDPFRSWYYRASLKSASRILVPSTFTAQEISRHFPRLQSRLKQVFLGVSEAFHPDPEEAARVRRQFSLPARFFLHVGDIHPRRNLDLLAAVASSMDYKLVLIGRVRRGGESFANWPFRFTGLSRDQLRGFYSAADLFLYASEYEGFGLPLLEAMACGLPVVAVGRASVPEVCGEAAVLVEPQLEDLTLGVQEALESREAYSLLGKERAAQFSWRRTAEETRAAYTELL